MDLFRVSLEFGGSNTLNKNGDSTARVEFSGIGCAHIEGRTEACSDHAKRWLELRAKLESLGAKLTRVDVAYDDFQRRRGVAFARQLWQSGAFDNRGQRPKVRWPRESYYGVPQSQLDWQQAHRLPAAELASPPVTGGLAASKATPRIGPVYQPPDARLTR